MEKIELPKKWITISHVGFALFMMFGAYMIAPQTWGFYSAVVPGIAILAWLDACNIKWSVSKKYSIIKYISLMIFMAIIMTVGTYLTAH